MNRCEKHGKHAGICWDCAREAGREPPWLADAAEALGEVRPEDGAPKALNWNQVLDAIHELREDRDHWKLRAERSEFAHAECAQQEAVLNELACPEGYLR